MNPKMLGLGALLLSVPTHSIAQITTTLPLAYVCKAECFRLDGTSGNVLAYEGKVESKPAVQKARAFQSLQRTCDSGVLLIRKLKSIVEEQNPSSHSDSQTSTWTSGYGCHLHVLHSNTNMTQYQIVDHTLRAVFDTEIATEENACPSEPAPHQPEPRRYSEDGDLLQG